MNRIAIIGAAAAGLAAAETLRREGFAGTLNLVGDESAPPYDRPPLSKQVLSGEWGEDRLPLRTADALAALDLNLRLDTRAAGLDTRARAVVLEGGGELAYDGLIIATGVTPRVLPSAPGARVHTLRTHADAVALREGMVPGRRLVVVGTGFLGAEVAAVAVEAGMRVTIVGPEAVMLREALGDDVGARLTALHRARGVDVRTGVGVTSVTTTGVLLGDGSSIAADEVLLAIGSLPATGWLADSSLTLDDGVLCDRFMAAAPGVAAAGDVARWWNPLFETSMRLEHRTNATEQGMAAARNLLRPEAPVPFAPVPYFWSDQFGIKLQAYGYLRGHDEVLIVRGTDGWESAGRRDGAPTLLALYRRGDRLVGVLAAGASPRELRGWRAAVADRTSWRAAVGELAGAMA